MFFFCRNTDVVMDSGDGVSHTGPKYEGGSLSHVTLRSDLADEDSTENTMNIFIERGYLFMATAASEIARDAKEQLCYVDADFDTETKAVAQSSDEEKTCELPDGNISTIGGERFRCQDVLLRPSLIGKEASGIHDTILQAVMKCDVDTRRDLYVTVVLLGDTPMFPGIGARITKELNAIAPSTVKISYLADVPPKDVVEVKDLACAEVLRNLDEACQVARITLRVTTDELQACGSQEEYDETMLKIGTQIHEMLKLCIRKLVSPLANETHFYPGDPDDMPFSMLELKYEESSLQFMIFFKKSVITSYLGNKALYSDTESRPKATVTELLLHEKAEEAKPEEKRKAERVRAPPAGQKHTFASHRGSEPRDAPEEGGRRQGGIPTSGETSGSRDAKDAPESISAPECKDAPGSVRAPECKEDDDPVGGWFEDDTEEHLLDTRRASAEDFSASCPCFDLSSPRGARESPREEGGHHQGGFAASDETDESCDAQSAPKSVRVPECSEQRAPESVHAPERNEEPMPDAMFDFLEENDLPNAEERLAALRRITRDMKGVEGLELAPETNLEGVAASTQGYTRADLMWLCQEAMNLGRDEQRQTIDEEHFMAALDNYARSVPAGGPEGGGAFRPATAAVAVATMVHNAIAIPPPRCHKPLSILRLCRASPSPRKSKTCRRPSPLTKRTLRPRRSIATRSPRLAGPRREIF